MKKIFFNFVVYMCFGVTMLANMDCTKQDSFLDVKPNISLATITTLNDCQLLLSNENVFNRSGDPGLGSISTDDFYIGTDIWTTADTKEKNAYIYSKQIYVAGESISDWNQPYQQIYYSNVVLDALSTMSISSNEQSNFNQLKGSALFYRSYAFYSLLQTFSMPYDSMTANQQLGIPLRLNSDLNIKSIRSNQKDCYNQIINDLEASTMLLSINSSYVTQPSKAAAYALLARVSLVMGSYGKSLSYSNKCLSINNKLLDYNNIVPGAFYLFANSSQYPLVEDLYNATLKNFVTISFTRAIVDTILYKSYDDNDLRKTAYFTAFNGQIRFKGSYEFKIYGLNYSGLATDEIYLIRAESNARSGNVVSAMDDLNTLLKNRYKTGTFTPLTATDNEDALKQILKERQKELCFRGLRWTDLRRLNKEPRFAVTLTHIINGTRYTLPPNDSRYAFPIPDNEISVSGIEQNVR